MSRRVTVLLAALESALIVGIGIAIPLVPLTVLWAAYFGFGIDWLVVWRGALDVWLLGHGVDVTFRLDAATAAALGLAGADAPVKVTIAALGFALVSALLAARAGRRVAETGHLVLGGAALVATTAALSLGATGVSLHPDARPSLVQAAILPPLVVALGAAVGMLTAPRRAPGHRFAARLDRATRRLDPALRAGLAGAARIGLGAASLTVAAAAVVLAVAFLVRYAEIIRLYESLHGEVLGGAVVTVAELALLPNLVVWTASWLVGPGFALGAGSVVSPIGTTLGPVPAVPVLGAIPPGDLPFALAGVLVPVASAFLVAAAVRRRDPDAGPGTAPRSPLALAGVALGGGALGGLAIGLLAAASAGAAGPGRLVSVGPDPLVVGIVAAVEFAVAGGLGLAVGGRRPRRPGVADGRAPRGRGTAARRADGAAESRPGAAGRPTASH